MNVAQLGELVESVSNCDPKLVYGMNEFTYIDIGSISQLSKAIENPQSLRGLNAPSRARQVVALNDVLVSTVRPNLNAVALVGKEHDGAIASTGFTILRAKASKLDPIYLSHWVRTESFISTLMSQATGQSYPAVSDRIVKATSIPLPPLSEQKRIAAILDQADALRRLRRRVLDSLKKLPETIVLQAMNRNHLQWLNMSDVAEETRNSFCNGPFGSDLLTCELLPEGVPVIYIRDIAGGSYMRKSTSCVSPLKAEQLSACAVRPGDLLIAKVGDPPCTSAIYPAGHENAIVTQDVIRIRTRESRACAIFLSTLLNSSYGRSAVRRITVQATRARVSLKDLKELPIQLPSVNIQKAVGQKITEISRQVETHTIALEASERIFTSLQHRAFCGEL